MIKIKMSEVFDIAEVMVNYDDSIFYVLASEDTQTPPQPYFPLVADFINQINFVDLGNDYHISYSADKYLSPFGVKTLERTIRSYNYTLEDFLSNNIPSVTRKQIIQDWLWLGDFCIVPLIYNRFAVKWKKIYDALMSQYNPINNYDMEEKRTPNLTHTETFNNVQDQRTPNLTTTGSANAKTGVFGFNGATAKDSATNDGTSSESVTGTDTNVKTGNIATTETGTDTLTRKGNIGVTSSQQLIESEWELRKHDFYAMIYKDIDSILCLKIY